MKCSVPDAVIVPLGSSPVRTNVSTYQHPTSPPSIVVLNAAVASKHGPEKTGVWAPLTTGPAALAGAATRIVAIVAVTSTSNRVLISTTSLCGRGVFTRPTDAIGPKGFFVDRRSWSDPQLKARE